jgi:predicted nucleic acid-binding protein
MKISLDADVVVEIVSKDSERHAVTFACYERHRQAGNEIILVENVLLEAFHVLSSAPKPTGVPPREAVQLLQYDFGDAITAPVRRGLAWDTIHHTLGRGFAGGRVFDAAIALAAYEAGARLLLTWNVRHFISIAPVGLEIRQP